MDANRFDTISKLFASRKTRRAALKGTGVGMAAAAVAPLAGRVAAQGATPAVDPNDPHPSADGAGADPMFLFVQPFDTGAWAPKAGEDGVYTLTLTGAAANTIYFSDRPERIVGLAENQQFLDGLGFSPNNPPNAAIVAPHEDGDGQEILVIELLNPAYDADAETLTYDATVLADYGEHGLAHLANQQQDYEIGETFGAGGLFIDDCSNADATCYQIVNGENQVIGDIHSAGCSWHSSTFSCRPVESDDSASYYGKLCAEAYPDQCSYYSNGLNGWDCYAENVQCNGW